MPNFCPLKYAVYTGHWGL